jgi:hypothetical protein
MSLPSFLQEVISSLNAVCDLVVTSMVLPAVAGTWCVLLGCAHSSSLSMIFGVADILPHSYLLGFGLLFNTSWCYLPYLLTINLCSAVLYAARWNAALMQNPYLMPMLKFFTIFSYVCFTIPLTSVELLRWECVSFLFFWIIYLFEYFRGVVIRDPMGGVRYAAPYDRIERQVLPPMHFENEALRHELLDVRAELLALRERHDLLLDLIARNELALGQRDAMIVALQKTDEFTFYQKLVSAIKDAKDEDYQNAVACAAVIKEIEEYQYPEDGSDADAVLERLKESRDFVSDVDHEEILEFAELDEGYLAGLEDRLEELIEANAELRFDEVVEEQ